VHKLTKDHAANLWPSIEKLAVSYLSNSVHDEFSDEDVFDAVDPDSMDDAEQNLERLIEAKFNDLGIRVSDSAVETIVEAFDVSERSEEYFCQEPDYDYREERMFAAPQIDEVDDLFYRSH
jgi:hypothetical protein